MSHAYWFRTSAVGAMSKSARAAFASCARAPASALSSAKWRTISTRTSLSCSAKDPPPQPAKPATARAAIATRMMPPGTIQKPTVLDGETDTNHCKPDVSRPSGIEPAQRVGLRDPADRHEVRGRPPADLPLPVHRVHGLDRPIHQVPEPQVHLALRPEIALERLHPLEVRDRHPTRVREDVRDHELAVLEEHLVGVGGRGTVRALSDDPRLDARRVAAGDLALERA